MPENTPNLDSLFETAAGIESADERADYLDKSCGNNLELRRQLEKLLQSDQQVGSFLEEPPEGLDATMVQESSVENVPGKNVPGKRVAASMNAGLTAAFSVDEAVVVGDKNHSVLKMLGNTMAEVPHVSLREPATKGAEPISRPSSPEMPGKDSNNRYQLQGEIARGGMGAILKGRDTDLGRDLAIKVLLDSHKDDPQVVQRFVEEAQIGGQLQHPGIAPVYELGQFADQRPFFSMKLVKGETLAKLLAVREHAVDDRGKLIGIFEQVCQTMAYAHSRGVIHRDLKPANIMVGAFGEVQVMDWGLAKVLPSGGVADEKQAKKKQQKQSIIQTRRSASSDVPGSFGSAGSETQMGSVMGTPAYMPPEQALGEIDQMDERADVFGLGAILCEILTGQPPYVADAGTQVFRMASRGKLGDCIERLEACSADAELTRLAKHCMELEPADRPQNAGVVAESIAGYLESVETKLRETELASLNAQVRAEELGRRQRLTLVGGVAIAATLLVGIAASLWQMSRATAAEQLAKAEADRATLAEKETAETLVQVVAERDAKELARKEAEDISKFLEDVFRSPSPGRDGREIKVVELLDNAAQKLDAELADQPDQRAKLQGTLGKTYHALGIHQTAIRLQEQAREHHLANSGLEHPDTLNAMFDLAWSYYSDGRVPEALELLDDVLPLSQKILGAEHPDTLKVIGAVAYCLSSMGRLDEATKIGEGALPTMERVLGRDHPITLRQMTYLAFARKTAGRLDAALQLCDEAVTTSRRVLGTEHPDTLTAMFVLAGCYYETGRRDEALQMREEVLRLRVKVLGPEHPYTLKSLADLASSYYHAGQRDEAAKMWEKAMETSRKVLGPEHRDRLVYMDKLGFYYSNNGRRNEAIEIYEDLHLLFRKSRGPDHPSTLNTLTNLAYCYHGAGRYDEALEMRERVLKLCQKGIGLEHRCTLFAMTGLAQSYEKAGRRDEAIDIREEVLRIRRNVFGAEHTSTLDSMRYLANSYDKAGRLEEALHMREEKLPLRRKVLGSEHPDTLKAKNKLAKSYNDLGFELDAEGKTDGAIDIWQKALELNPELNSKALFRLGELLEETGNVDEAFIAYLTAVRNDVMTRQADQKSQRILSDPENVQACLHAIKSKPDLSATALSSFASVGRTAKTVALLAEKLKSLAELDADNVHLLVALAQTSLPLAADASKKSLNLLEASVDSQSTDVAQISRRAAAYIAIKQYDLAKADWLRVVKLESEQLKPAFNAFRKAEQWNTAAEFAQSYLEQKPEDSWRWVQVAPVMLLSGDDDRYEGFCKWISLQTRAQEKDDMFLIMASVLSDKALDISVLTSDRLAIALDSGKLPDWQLYWGWGTQALLAYRAREHERVLECVRKSEKNDPDEVCHAENLLILAMAHHELDHSDDAKNCLAEASLLITSLIEDPARRGPHDLLFTRILFREAETKINGKIDSPDKHSTLPAKLSNPSAEEQSIANSIDPEDGDGN